MKRLLPILLMLAILLGGCKSIPSREEVFVLDISQSIDADAEQQMFAVVEDAAQHLHRGDTLTIIPITGDAEAELQGRTLHYEVPSVEDRQAYDADLRNLNAQMKADLDRLQVDAVAHPGKHTDIIGSIRVAMMAFSERSVDKRLVVLSDFIQEDSQFNFRRDPRLTNETDATAFGKGLMLPKGDYQMVKVTLGRLKSNEFSALPPNRQRAINAFWEQAMSPAVVEPDGTAAIAYLCSNR